MANFVLLDPAEHAHLKVSTERSAAYGDDVHFAMTFPFEFRNIQGCYPIFFQKDSGSGKFYPVALFGFERGENLFLNEAGWDARYVPVMIRRQPFLIGFQDDPEKPGQKRAIVSIDMDNPRVNETQGEALFPEGRTSAFLQEVSANLELIHQASEHSKRFVDALIEHDLLEAFTLEITLKDGSGNQLMGFYTINEDSLRQLSGPAFASLNEQGFLQPIYMAVASHSRLAELIDRKNDTL